MIDCNCPLMRGKKGELVWCGCGKDYSKSTPTQAKVRGYFLFFRQMKTQKLKKLRVSILKSYFFNN